jgi:hypothetical protein
MSPSIKSNFTLWLSADTVFTTSSILALEPVAKLSRPHTLKPFFRKNSSRFEPIKPAAPVINIFNFFISLSIINEFKSIFTTSSI